MVQLDARPTGGFSWMRVQLVIRRLRVPPLVRQHSFVEIYLEKFSAITLLSADSKRAVVSFWQKNVHNTG